MAAILDATLDFRESTRRILEDFYMLEDMYEHPLFNPPKQAIGRRQPIKRNSRDSSFEIEEMRGTTPENGTSHATHAITPTGTDNKEMLPQPIPPPRRRRHTLVEISESSPGTQNSTPNNGERKSSVPAMNLNAISELETLNINSEDITAPETAKDTAPFVGKRSDVITEGLSARLRGRKCSVPVIPVSDQKKLQDMYEKVMNTDHEQNAPSSDEGESNTIEIPNRRHNRKFSLPEIKVSDQKKLQDLAKIVEKNKKTKIFNFLRKPLFQKQPRVNENGAHQMNEQKNTSVYQSVPENLNSLPEGQLSNSKKGLMSWNRIKNNAWEKIKGVRRQSQEGNVSDLVRLAGEQRVNLFKSSYPSDEAAPHPVAGERDRSKTFPEPVPCRKSFPRSPKTSHLWGSRKSCEFTIAESSETYSTRDRLAADHSRRSSSSNSLYSLYIASILSDRHSSTNLPDDQEPASSTGTRYSKDIIPTSTDFAPSKYDLLRADKIGMSSLSVTGALSFEADDISRENARSSTVDGSARYLGASTRSSQSDRSISKAISSETDFEFNSPPSIKASTFHDNVGFTTDSIPSFNGLGDSISTLDTSTSSFLTDFSASGAIPHIEGALPFGADNISSGITASGNVLSVAGSAKYLGASTRSSQRDFNISNAISSDDNFKTNSPPSINVSTFHDNVRFTTDSIPSFNGLGDSISTLDTSTSSFLTDFSASSAIPHIEGALPFGADNISSGITASGNVLSVAGSAKYLGASTRSSQRDFNISNAISSDDDFKTHSPPSINVSTFDDDFCFTTGSIPSFNGFGDSISALDTSTSSFFTDFSASSAIPQFEDSQRDVKDTPNVEKS